MRHYPFSAGDGLVDTQVVHIWNDGPLRHWVLLQHATHHSLHEHIHFAEAEDKAVACAYLPLVITITVWNGKRCCFILS